MSSGGGGSESGGYSSKLVVSIGLRTFGIIGGSNVLARRPSQLNPSNHLKVFHNFLKHAS